MDAVDDIVRLIGEIDAKLGEGFAVANPLLVQAALVAERVDYGIGHLDSRVADAVKEAFGGKNYLTNPQSVNSVLYLAIEEQIAPAISHALYHAFEQQRKRKDNRD